MARKNQTPAPLPLAPRPRDPLARIARLAQILAIGLIAAACFLAFPNTLNRTGTRGIPVTLDAFPDPLTKLAVGAVHTRATWVTLAVISACIAMGSTRRDPRQATRIRIAGTAALLAVITIHALLQAYLQSKSPLIVEARGIAPGDSSPSITRLRINEGTPEAWQLLFAGDALFCAPVLLVWLLHFLTKPKTPKPRD